MAGESLDDVTLVDPSVLGDPETLRAQAEAALRADGAEPHRAGHYDGIDETGSVKVTVDPLGRLADVFIDLRWKDTLGAEHVAGGVYGAYVAAVQKAMVAEAATRGDRPAPVSPEPDTGWLSPPAPGAAGFDAWLARVKSSIAEANARLDRLAAPEPARPAEDVRSPNGFLTLRVRAGNLEGIDGNPTGLRLTDEVALRRDVLAVFRAAGLAEPWHETGNEDDETNENLGIADY